MPSQGQPATNRIFSATYSNVPVYEYTIDGDQIMRRRADDYINATHILKAAGFDKPARTRILEREVQKGIHEKVQGGYGKYQGTWIPQRDAIALAEKNGVYDKLRPIFEYVPGDRSPPPAPKHTTAQSSKPRAPRQSGGAAARRPADHARLSDANYPAYAPRETPDHMSVRSGSPYDYPGSRHSASQPRKRKRDINEPVPVSREDDEHQIWTNELLDYFICHVDVENATEYPDPPRGINIERAIDEKGHTAMHWASAMGDVGVVRDLLSRGARMDSQAHNGETPLMRAVMFVNNYDRQSMDQLFRSLVNTSPLTDHHGSTVFHHLVQTTSSKSKYASARYYLETILDRMKNSHRPGDIVNLLNQQDHAGDTPVLIAAKFGARKCVRILLNAGASSDIANLVGETAEQYIEKLNARRRERYGVSHDGGIASSSPPRDFGSSNGAHGFGELDGASRTPSKRLRTSYRSEAATTLSSQLPALIESRTQALAAEFEKDLAEQEASVAEGAKALQLREEQISKLRRQHETASMTATQDVAGDFDDKSAATELESLESEIRDLLDTEQLAGLENDMHEAGSLPNGTSAHEDRRALAAQVLESQTKRQRLLEDIIEAIASTGSNGISILQGQNLNYVAQHDSKKMPKYLQLIRTAMGKTAEEGIDIESALPEILQDLEEAQALQQETEEQHGGNDVGDMMQLDGVSPNQTQGYMNAGYGFGAISNERGSVGVMSR